MPLSIIKVPLHALKPYNFHVCFMWDEFAPYVLTVAQDHVYPEPPKYSAAVVQPAPMIMQQEVTVVQPTVIQTQPTVMVVNPVGECSTLLPD